MRDVLCPVNNNLFVNFFNNNKEAEMRSFTKQFAAVVFGMWFLLMLIPAAPGAAQEKADDRQSEQDEISFYELEQQLMVSVATKTKTTVQEAPSIVSVITGEEIRNMGARNILDVLRTVPGFDITNMASGSVHKTVVRGMSSSLFNDKTKIMMDGHSLSVHYGESHSHFDRLPIDNIRQIEIIRGPGSALYGTGAFIAVINIITKKGGDEPSEISVSGGSYGTFKPYGELSYKKDDVSVYAYADYYTTDGYDGLIESDAFGTYPKSAAPGNINTDAKYHTFQTTVGYKDFYFSGFFQKINVTVPVGVANALTDEHDAKYKMAFAEGGYRLHLQDKGSILFKAYYDYGEQDSITEVFSEETTATLFKWTNGEGMSGSPNAKNSILGGEITADYKVYDGIQLVAGTSYEKFEQYDVKQYANGNITGAPLVVNGITYAPYQYLGGLVDISENGNWMKDADRSVAAVYGQGILDFKKLFSLEKGVSELSLTAGLRYDNYDDVGSSLNPRAGLVYAPVKDLYFKLLYGNAFRAPSMREMYMANNPSSMGNPDLEPETISTTEALIGYNFTDRIKSSVTFFNVQADDIIQRIIEGGKAIGTLKNVGSMESKGIEAELKVSFDKSKYAYLNLTWQDVNNTSGAVITSKGGQVYTQDDFNPGGIPDFIANLGVNYDLSKYVFANVSVNYVGEKNRSEEKKWDGENLVSVDKRDALKDRTLVNAAFTFRNFWKGMEIQLSGYNLFDADHREPDPVGSLPNDLPEAGRIFMGKVSYSF
jgi:outer membrane receptor protein involved in Fe transport